MFKEVYYTDPFLSPITGKLSSILDLSFVFNKPNPDYPNSQGLLDLVNNPYPSPLVKVQPVTGKLIAAIPGDDYLTMSDLKIASVAVLLAFADDTSKKYFPGGVAIPDLFKKDGDSNGDLMLTKPAKDSADKKSHLYNAGNFKGYLDNLTTNLHEWVNQQQITIGDNFPYVSDVEGSGALSSSIPVYLKEDLTRARFIHAGYEALYTKFWVYKPFQINSDSSVTLGFLPALPIQFQFGIVQNSLIGGDYSCFEHKISSNYKYFDVAHQFFLPTEYSFIINHGYGKSKIDQIPVYTVKLINVFTSDDDPLKIDWNFGKFINVNFNRDVDMGNYIIRRHGYPSNINDVANKAYVDDQDSLLERKIQSEINTIVSDINKGFYNIEQDIWEINEDIDLLKNPSTTHNNKLPVSDTLVTYDYFQEEISKLDNKSSPSNLFIDKDEDSCDEIVMPSIYTNNQITNVGFIKDQVLKSSDNIKQWFIDMIDSEGILA